MAEVVAKHKPILCLDFDGVIHQYVSGWWGADVVNDGPVPGAAKFLVDASQHFTLYVHSSRSNQPGGIDAMAIAIMCWLTDEYHGNVQRSGDLLTAQLEDQPEFRVHFAREKPPATVTLDDRAVTFTGTWPAPAELAAFKPWNKK